MSKTSVLVQCLRDIAPDYPAAPLEQCADRMGELRSLLVEAAHYVPAYSCLKSIIEEKVK